MPSARAGGRERIQQMKGGRGQGGRLSVGKPNQSGSK